MSLMVVLLQSASFFHIFIQSIMIGIISATFKISLWNFLLIKRKWALEDNHRNWNFLSKLLLLIVWPFQTLRWVLGLSEEYGIHLSATPIIPWFPLTSQLMSRSINMGLINGEQECYCYEGDRGIESVNLSKSALIREWAFAITISGWLHLLFWASSLLIALVVLLIIMIYKFPLRAIKYLKVGKKYMDD